MGRECTSPGKKHAQPPSRGGTLFPVGSLYRFDQKKAIPPTCFPLLPPILFPGLSRCGVSDGAVPQRGTSRIGQPIRGPDAGQSRQPQRVQPGGFFRPLFGRSKRGHPDGPDGQGGYTKESTHMERLSNHRGGHLPPHRFPTECQSTRFCAGTAAGYGRCDWPPRRQGGRFRNRRCPQRIPERGLKGVPSTRN
jgi:hypothetical protein